MQERPSQEDEAERALGEVRDALLDHCDGHLVTPEVALAISRLRRVRLKIGVSGPVQAASRADDGQALALVFGWELSPVPFLRQAVRMGRWRQ